MENPTLIGKCAKISILIGLTSLSTNIFARIITTTLPVTTNVINECNIRVSSIDFGVYDPVVANVNIDLDSTGTIYLACTKNTPATITLNNGLYGNRQASNGTDLLNYQLYTNSNRSLIWGTGTNARAWTSISKNETALTIYARLFKGQDVSMGSYHDTVVVTVTF